MFILFIWTQQVKSNTIPYMLYIVPVPIGNLDDITIRAKKVLEKSKVVLCEDGRITSKLFKLLEITNKPHFVNIVKNHQFNHDGIKYAIQKLSKTHVAKQGIYFSSPKKILEQDDCVISLVSDAGTPGISDPAYEVIALCQAMKIKYTTLPGATAFVPAIVNSNLVGSDFWFTGFLPIKKGRQKKWQSICESNIPVVIYESVHRMPKLIEEIKEKLKPGRKISISQEISKLHETIWVGQVSDLSYFELVSKGEFVIIIDKKTI